MNILPFPIILTKNRERTACQQIGREVYTPREMRVSAAGRGFTVAGTEFVTGEVRIIRVSTIIATESLGTKAMIADGAGYKKAVNRSIWDTFPSKSFSSRVGLRTIGASSFTTKLT